MEQEKFFSIQNEMKLKDKNNYQKTKINTYTQAASQLNTILKCCVHLKTVGIEETDCTEIRANWLPVYLVAGNNWISEICNFLRNPLQN